MWQELMNRRNLSKNIKMSDCKWINGTNKPTTRFDLWKTNTIEGDNRVCGHYPATNQLLLLSSFSCSSFTSFSTSHASSSSSSVWGVWSHSQKCLKLPSSSGAEFSTSLRFGLSLPRLLRRWGGSFGGGGLGGTLEGFAGLGVSGTGHRLMVPPPPPSSSLCDWPSSCFCWGGCCWDEQMDLGWRTIKTVTNLILGRNVKLLLKMLRKRRAQSLVP